MLIAPVVQWIEYKIADLAIQVRLLAGAPSRELVRALEKDSYYILLISSINLSKVLDEYIFVSNSVFNFLDSII